MPPEGDHPQILTPTNPAESPPQVAGTPQAHPAAGGSPLAGKFNSVEDLETGYRELSTKLGQQSTEITQLKAQVAPPPPEGTPQVPTTSELSPTTSVSDIVVQAGLDPKTLVQQWIQHGELTPTQYEKLHHKNMTRTMTDEWFALNSKDTELTQLKIQAALDRATALAGGQQQMDNLLAWAGGNLDEEQKAKINAQLSDPSMAEDAVHTLLSRHAQAVGASGAGGASLQEPGATNITQAAPNNRQSISEVMRKAAAGDSAAQQQMLRIPNEDLQGAYT